MVQMIGMAERQFHRNYKLDSRIRQGFERRVPFLLRWDPARNLAGNSEDKIFFFGPRTYPGSRNSIFSFRGNTPSWSNLIAIQSDSETFDTVSAKLDEQSPSSA